MLEPKTIQVTAEHIEKGERAKCGKCPIALAMAEAYPGYAPHVDGVYVEILAQGGAFLRMNPTPEIDLFIEAFDAGLAVQPFSFEFIPEVTNYV